MQWSESSGGNLRLLTSCSAPSFRTYGRHATKVYGRGSRHCYAIRYVSIPRGCQPLTRGRLAARVEHRTTDATWTMLLPAVKAIVFWGKGGEVLKDEIAHEIVSELRLIREELQNLTMAIRSANSSRNSENSYTRKPPKFYPRRTANQPDMRHSQGHKPPRSPQRGQPRSQWHQNPPKDTR